MDPYLENPTLEVKRLQHCMNTLLSVQALPAMWSGNEPSRILETVLDALLSTLHLEFVCARLIFAGPETPLEVIRSSPSHASGTILDEVRTTLDGLPLSDTRDTTLRINLKLRDHEIAVYRAPLEMSGTLGAIFAGSSHTGFPEQTDRLILGVAANQTAIGLQQALRLREQEAITRNLDDCISERTMELAVANQELRKEIGERIETEIRLRASEEQLRRSEDALRSNGQNLSLIINTMPALAWSALPDGKVDFFNKRWLDYTGLSPERAAGWGWTSALHSDDLQRMRKYWSAMITTGESGEIEARLRRFDGDYRWFLFRADPMRDDRGTILKWYGTNTDIDDRKRAEERLQLRELNLLQITETIPEMLWSATPDGAIDYCNGRLLEYTGFSTESVMKNGWKNLLHPADMDGAAEIWNSCVKTGTPYRVEVRTIHATDQTYRWCVTSALPLRDEEGRILRWHGTVVDMHDWKQAQDDLREAHAELARMMRVTTIGQLTASIAHEVSQPLSGIITNASTCLRMLDSQPPNLLGARETTLRTIRDSNRASDVIDRVRTLFSKKQAVIEQVNLNEIASEVLTLLSAELQKDDVLLQQHFDENCPAVSGDHVQLQQVILNLLRNAAEAMKAVHNHPRRLLVQTEASGGSVTLSVVDSGTGIPPEISHRLFESFFTTKADGMGVGLAVSRSIIEAHHGRLWVTKNDGPGSTFSFSLPRDAASESAAGLTSTLNLSAEG
jgi:PAS domain S-box-containing protein